MAEFLISCIVPVYNGAAYLRQALNSILDQTFRPLDIIVADDGSTDETPAIAAAYAPKVRYLNQPNGGTAAACNLGVAAARGDFIAFLAHDDLWHPVKLERQMARFHANPKLAGCVTHVKSFVSPELRPENIAAVPQSVFVSVPGYVPQTLLARKALLDMVGGFNTALRHADATEWFLRVREYGALIDLMSDVLVYRRLHQNNLSRRMADASRAEYLQLLKTALDRRRGSLPNEKTREGK